MSSESENYEDDENSTEGEYGQEDQQDIIEEAETLEKQEESVDATTTENIEKNDDEPLDEEFIQIFGDHPNNSKAVKVPYHAEILSRWQHWFQQGIKKDRRDELLEKFENPPGLNPPKMNPEILLKLRELLCEMMRSQTKSRPAFIIPILDDDGRAILKDTEPGEFLVGDKLTEKFKEGTTMIRVAVHSENFLTPTKTSLGLRNI
ncbi:hypothetical protein QAD02_019632 [Eretmocerus hayati]|uniref:Uncharacterized protein n=1 Tax=Eretmocerus hayati TaxID=131215 RepID=A0ACC2PK86_9HYME|nr:hypothetical protein QAD02_019632 [Eretmocerus hayati]